MKKNEKIFEREEDFAKWYTSIVINSQIVEYGLVKGTMVLKPYGFRLWENIKQEIDNRLNNLGIMNCALPTFIPYSEFVKEAKHIQGFSPEIFKVTELKNKRLKDPYVIRPTSEISFCHYFKNNINSYNDLPIKLNQWCNIFRVENNTRPFLRTSEFYWQEQHSAFSSSIESENFSIEMINLYKTFLKDQLAIPVLLGYKTESEKFAGAKKTYTVEGIMQDGQVLQCATSHDLCQNFSLPFEIKFQNTNNSYSSVYQTSAGISTRIIGALIMVHSDDNGLIIPPRIAPIQVKINTLFGDKEPDVLKLAEEIKNRLNSIRVFIDGGNKQLGFKMSEGEVQGIPIQINIGPKNIQNSEIELVVRNENNKQIFKSIEIDYDLISNILENYHFNIYDRAKKNLKSKIQDINYYEELEQILTDKKVAFGYWAGNSNDENIIKKETGATARCLVETKEEGHCFFTKKKTNIKAYFGRAY